MKAIFHEKYGSPEVLELRDVPKPAPCADEVLIKVRAASVNPYDWRHLMADPFLVRLFAGLFKPKDQRLGSDLAGVVEAIGKDTTQFKPGDEVYGSARGGKGAYAEYVCARQTSISLKPSNASFEEAAAIPMTGYTALQALRDTGKIGKGITVLVNGASGGIGTLAVQIAKSFETEVTGVCSTRNIELVRSLGANHVIDYTKTDFSRDGRKYDLIVDNVANHSVSDYARSLNPGGVCAVTGFSTVSNMLMLTVWGEIVSRATGKKITGTMARIDAKDLYVLKELVESGKVKPVIDRVYPFEQTAAAIGYSSQGHARGKVVIKI